MTMLAITNPDNAFGWMVLVAILAAWFIGAFLPPTNRGN